MVTNYLLDIVILLAAAVIAVPLFRAAGLGAVPGFLVAGVLVGPHGLALIDNVTEIGQLAELGVVLLLFVIGIELKPARLWLMRRLVFGLGTLQFVITGALLTAGAYFVFAVPFRTAILIGPALALSSTAFVMQLLAEQKMLHSEYGRTSFSILLLQDLAVVPLLALVPLLAAPALTVGADIVLALAQAIGILLLAIVGGRYLLQPILHRVTGARNREVFTALAVLLVLGSALLTEVVGLSMAMGAFIAGLLIADSPFRHGVIAEIQPFRGLLLGLFFMSMGMTLNLGEFFAQPLTVLGMLVALVTVKFVVLWVLALSFGLRTKVSAAVAMLLSQSGEFGLVLFAYTYQAQLMSTDLYVQLLLVIVLSMLVTPPLAYLARQLAAARTDQQNADDEVPSRAPVVLAGFGRVGRHIGQILMLAGEPYVAIDTDSSLVLRERANGHHIFYGDARRAEVRRAVGVKDADLVIVTVDDAATTENIVAALHQAYPKVTILARGHDADHCRKLRKLGATIAVSETLGASLELARQVLIRDDRDSAKVEALLRRFHRERDDNSNARNKREASNRTGA
jgi:monovalent cation:proton antiporter-2 (CPA2) family protein